jgi:DegV family protein with EDD domain
MGKIKIVTDSTCSIPPDLIERYGISVIPYSIQFATEGYRDGVDIDVEGFHRKLRSEGVMPKTAIPSPGEFTELYRSIAEPGDSIISIHAGKKVSGICGSAELASAELPDFDIAIVDSNIVSMPVGFMVLEAAKAAEAGKSKDEILALVEEVKENTLFFATSVELEHIKESGRIVGAEEAADSAVKVKPVIRFIDGTPQVIDKKRTQSAVLKRMIELVKEEAAGRSIKQVAITHANVEPAALDFKPKVEEALSPPEIIVTELGPTLTVHLGPGSLSLTAYFSS